MEGIVFVPGIFGSELYYNENGATQIWPPGPFDLGGYRQIAELSDPARVTVGNVVDYVALPLLLPVYSVIESDLRDIANRINASDDGPYLPVPYDWRIDLFTSARLLERQVTQWAAPGSGVTAITFFAHSMGGLVVRLLLENILAQTAPAERPAWVSMVRRAVFACTPHLGATKALSLGLGLEGDETLKPDQCKALAADPHFASAYQLFPSPARNLVFNTGDSQWVPYDRSDFVAAFGLSSANLVAAARLRAALNIAKRTPADVSYYFMYGTGLPTDEAIDIHGLAAAGAMLVTDDKGDGTVPSWSITEAASGATPPVPTWCGPGEHLQLLTTDAFRQALYRYFGLGSSAPVFASAHETGAAGVTVHTDKRQYMPGATVSALLTPDQPTETLSGALQIRRVHAAQSEGQWSFTPATTPVATKTVRIEGGPVKAHPVEIAAPFAPGAYQIAFAGEGATHVSPTDAPAWFFVAAAPDRPPHGAPAPRPA